MPVLVSEKIFGTWYWVLGVGTGYWVLEVVLGTGVSCKVPVLQGEDLLRPPKPVAHFTLFLLLLCSGFFRDFLNLRSLPGVEFWATPLPWFGLTFRRGSFIRTFLLYNGVECSNNGRLHTQSGCAVFACTSQSVPSNTQSGKQSPNIQPQIRRLVYLNVNLWEILQKYEFRYLTFFCDILLNRNWTSFVWDYKREPRVEHMFLDKRKWEWKVDE